MVRIQGYLALDMIRKNNLLELIKGGLATTTNGLALRTAVPAVRRWQIRSSRF
ncbi:MAG: hypothetical protein R3C44_14990 [Chloroflexota bacterium]